MGYPLRIAFRYFLSKSRQTTINRINALALILVVLSTTSLFVVLSAFSGLRAFGLSFSNRFDPDFTVRPEKGKYFTIDTTTLSKIKELPCVISVAPEIEEKVFLSFREKNQVALLKAVTPDYTSVVSIDSLIYIGDWIDFEDAKAVVGLGIATKLGIGIYDYDSFLEITVPKKARASNIANPQSFNILPTYIVGVYQISEDLDQKYIFTSIDFARELLSLKPDTITNLALKTTLETTKETLAFELKRIIQQPIDIKSRMEQNAALYKMLNIENLAIYFVFTLVMIIALFNVIGALIMMIIDKQSQMKILITMGATPQSIRTIFCIIGLLICGFGGLIGVVLGSLIVFVQSTFPFLDVPGTTIPYPVIFSVKNFFIVLGTLFFLGSISTIWATHGVGKKARGYVTKS